LIAGRRRWCCLHMIKRCFIILSKFDKKIDNFLMSFLGVMFAPTGFHQF